MTVKAWNNRLLGGLDEFSLKQRLFNAAALISGIMCVIITVVDFIHGIGDVSPFFTLIPAGIFLIMYAYARKKGANRLLIFCLLGTAIIGLVYDWAFFYGMQGSSLLIIVSVSVWIPTILDNKAKWWSLAGLYTLAFTLFFLETSNIYNPGTYPDEVSHITDLFTTASVLLFSMTFMVTAIVNSNKEYRQKTLKLNEELLRSNSELRNALDSKNRILSVISHDLRGPVGAINGLTELLHQKNQSDNNPNELKDIKEAMNTSSNSALHLLDNLLNWARTEKGDVIPQIETLSIKSIVEENLTLLSSNIQLKKINIENNCTEHCQVVGDKDMLDVIVRNILTNAVKFTPNKGSILISSKVEDENLIISIKDNGIGIPRAKINSLFKENYKESRTGTNNELGTGLGLKLCKHYMQILEGQIWVESDESKGSTFYLSLTHVPQKAHVSMNYPEYKN